jgi:hypothetical protein
MLARKHIILVACLVLLFIRAGKQAGAGYFLTDDSAAAGAQFLSLGTGARAAALGEAYCAVAADVSAITWNPAGLTRLTSPQLLATHAFAVENTYYGFLGYALPLSDSALGIGLNYLSMLPLERLDASGESEGTFQPADLALNLAYARAWPGLALGVNVKVISEDLDGVVATAYALDVGGLVPLAGDTLRLGWALQNLGTPVKFVQQADPLPVTVRAGLAWWLMPGLLAAAEIAAPWDHAPAWHLGGEYQTALSSELALSVRAGFKTANAAGTGAGSGLAFGLGAAYSGLTVDYAWVPFGALGSIQRLALTAAFGERGVPPARTAAAPPETPALKTSAQVAKPAAVIVPQAETPAPEAPAISKTAAPAADAPEPDPEAKNISADQYAQWVEQYRTRAMVNFEAGKYYTAYTYCKQALAWDPERRDLQDLLDRIKTRLDESALAPQPTLTETPQVQP